MSRFLLGLVASVALAAPASAQLPVSMKAAPPELAGLEEWINTEPLKWKKLEGKVVVLFFWTYG